MGDLIALASRTGWLRAAHRRRSGGRAARSCDLESGAAPTSSGVGGGNCWLIEAFVIIPKKVTTPVSAPGWQIPFPATRGGQTNLFPDVRCVTRKGILPNGIRCANLAGAERRKGRIMNLLQYAVTRPVITNALKVALVVGLCLNAINQGAQLWYGEGVDWPKVGLNFLVPYLVASYSAARMFTKSRSD